jgi:hypothetical protein
MHVILVRLKETHKNNNKLTGNRICVQNETSPQFRNIFLSRLYVCSVFPCKLVSKMYISSRLVRTDSLNTSAEKAKVINSVCACILARSLFSGFLTKTQTFILMFARFSAEQSVQILRKRSRHMSNLNE